MRKKKQQKREPVRGRPSDLLQARQSTGSKEESQDPRAFLLHTAYQRKDDRLWHWEGKAGVLREGLSSPLVGGAGCSLKIQEEFPSPPTAVLPGQPSPA